MKQKAKNILEFLLRKYRFYSSSRSYNKRYKNYSSELFENDLNKDIIKQYKEKWGVYGEKVDARAFILGYNLSGKINYNIIPENLFAAIIEKELNSLKELSFFSIKNIYEKWFENKEVFPQAYFHKIDGVYYDNRYNLIGDIFKYVEETEFEFPLILKPSKDTGGGTGVKKIETKEELVNSLTGWNFLVCQELIKQHDYINKINSGSLNTVRCCLYKDVTGKFRIINNSIRFGVNGSLDNEASGGIVCFVNDLGELNNFALDKKCKKYYKHPDSLIEFSNLKIPLFDEMRKLVLSLANQNPFCNLIGFDMVLDNKGHWRCIEMNYKSQSIRFAQYAGEGFFGDYTNEVILRTNK